VETHALGQLANLEGEVPAGWISGTFPDDTPKDCPVGTPSHGDLNKDEAWRPNFAEAYADAILAVQAQLAVFASELCTANPGRAAGAHLRGGGVAERQGLLLPWQPLLALRPGQRQRRRRLPQVDRRQLARARRPRHRHRRRVRGAQW